MIRSRLRFALTGASAVLVLCAIQLGGCSSGARYRSYVQTEGEPVLANLSSVELYVSALDSLGVHKHRFPTGYEAPAPNLDPREFLRPEELREQLAAGALDSGAPPPRIARPDREFVVLGEAIAEVAEKYSHDMPAEYVYTAPLDSLPFALHGKPYRELLNPDWEKTMDRFYESIIDTGADAIIEIYCGQGVEQYFISPTQTYVPMLAAGGGMVINNPGGFANTGWEIRGLAIRWKD